MRRSFCAAREPRSHQDHTPGGRPAHFVSGQARCFTGRVFRRVLERLGVRQGFGYFRPHQGLGGATPAEIYFVRTPACLVVAVPGQARAAVTTAVSRERRR
jgi:hypothetical protein